MRAAVVMVQVDGEILFLRRGPTDPWKPGFWNFPGGVVEDMEEIYETALRELEEEAGLSVSARHLRYMGRYQSVHLYSLRLAKKPKIRLLDGEHDAYVWALPTDPPRPMIPFLKMVFQHPVGTAPQRGNGHVPRRRSTSR